MEAECWAVVGGSTAEARRVDAGEWHGAESGKTRRARGVWVCSRRAQGGAGGGVAPDKSTSREYVQGRGEGAARAANRRGETERCRGRSR